MPFIQRPYGRGFAPYFVIHRWRSVSSVSPCSWKPSCNFFPGKNYISYLAEHFDRLDVVKQSSSSDFHSFYSFLLVLQKHKNGIEGPIGVLSSLVGNVLHLSSNPVPMHKSTESKNFRSRLK